MIELADYKPPRSVGDDELMVLMTELKVGLNAYLAATPATVKTLSLADVIALSKANPRETVLFEQAKATKGLDDPAYLTARADSRRVAGAEGIDKLVADNRLDALITPNYGAAYRIDLVGGDHDQGQSSSLPAVAGYPHLTAPMGQVRGLPVGLSFIGPAWSEPQLLEIGYAFEQVAQARRAPTYTPSLEASEEIE